VGAPGGGCVIVVLLGTCEFAPVILKELGLLLERELASTLGVVEGMVGSLGLESFESEQPIANTFLCGSNDECVDMTLEVLVEICENIPEPRELLDLVGLQGLLDKGNEALPAHEKGQEVLELHRVGRRKAGDVRGEGGVVNVKRGT
jgi:hypothetical protein